MVLAHLVIDPIAVICSFVAGLAIGAYIFSTLKDKEKQR